MHHGALLAVGTPAEVMADATVQSAYLGEEL
jgi:branched-chain amino acid transport system ATP-binding protein